MNAASPPVPAPAWWSVAGWLFAACFGLIALVLVGALARGNWLDGPPSISVPASAFQVARGHAGEAAGALVIDGLDGSGTAIVSARVAPFEARRYPRVDWKILPNGDQRPQLALAWSTRERPARTFVQPLEWQEGGVAPLDLSAAEGWNGNVVGLALVVRAPLPRPLVVQGVTVPGISLTSAAREVLEQWANRHPDSGRMRAPPFDAERDHHLSLPAAVALALVLAAAVYAALARRRKWPLDARVFWALFLGGWLLLDARWQLDLWTQMQETHRLFAGRSSEEKLLAEQDGQVYAAVAELKARLPAAPARVLVLSDYERLQARAAYFLYPHSANGYYLSKLFGRRQSDPEDFHAGDYVLLLAFRGAAYDRAGGALLWPDGRRRAVDEIAFKDDGVALLRVR